MKNKHLFAHRLVATFGLTLALAGLGGPAVADNDSRVCVGSMGTVACVPPR